jgi:hypothetical protein
MGRCPANMIDVAKKFVSDLQELKQRKDTQPDSQGKFLSNVLQRQAIESPMLSFLVPNFLFQVGIMGDNPYQLNMGVDFNKRMEYVENLNNNRPDGFARGYFLAPPVVVRSPISGNIRK